MKGDTMSKGYLTRQETMHLCKAIGVTIAENVKATIEPLLAQNEDLLKQVGFCLTEIARLQQEVEALKAAHTDGRKAGRVIRLASASTAH